MFPKIPLVSLTILPLTVSKIYPTSNELKLPPELVNFIVFPEPVVKLN